MDFNILQFLADWSGVFVVAMGVIIIVFMFLIKNRIVESLTTVNTLLDDAATFKSNIFKKALETASALYFNKDTSQAVPSEQEVMELYNSILETAGSANLAAHFVTLVNEYKGAGVSTKTYSTFVKAVRKEFNLKGAVSAKNLVAVEIGRASCRERV